MNRYALTLLLAAVIPAAASPPFSQADFNEAITAAAQIEPGQDRSAFRRIEEQIRAGLSDPHLRNSIETGLLKLLEPGATDEAKAFACKHLSFAGSKKAIASLARLLDNEGLTPLATSALCAMSSGEADAALRAGLARTSGKPRVQIITALGDRKDTKSIEALARLAESPEPETSAAAAAALGKIGTSRAYQALSEASTKADSKVRPTLDQAMLACAGNLATKGNTRLARNIYNRFITPGHADYIRRAAFDSLLELSTDDGQKLAVQALREGDPILKPVAIEAVRSMRGSGIVPALTRELPNLPVKDQAALIDSLADRPEPAAYACVIDALSSTHPELRLAAIQALGRVGGQDAVPALTQAIAPNRPAEETRAFESAFSGLQGGSATDAAVAQSLQSARGEARTLLLKAMAARQGAAANKLLLDYAADADPDTSRAALRALAKTAEFTDAAGLVRLLKSAKSESVRTEARTACSRALSQTQSNEERFFAIQAGLSPAPSEPENTAALISLLPLCGTPPALAAVERGMASNKPEVRDAAMDALMDWPSIAAWNLLLPLYNANATGPERNNALRALTRLAGEANANFSPELITRYEELFAGAKTDADYKLILGALGGAAHPQALELAVKQLEKPGARAEAESAVRRIAKSIQALDPDAADAALQKLSSQQKT